MEMSVKDNPFFESIAIPVGNFSSGLVNPVVYVGEHFQTFLGLGVGSPLAGVFDGFQRRSAPRTSYLGEKPVLDGVVLGAVWGIVHHYNLQAYPVGKLDEVLFHDMVGTGVGAAPVAQHDKRPCIGIEGAEMLPPASFDVVAYELGGVMAGSYGEIACVAGEIVDAVRHYGTIGESGEVVVESLRCFSAEYTALPFEIPHKLLLLGVNADYRDSVLNTQVPDLVDFLELLVSALHLAHRDVLAERPCPEPVLLQELADEIAGDVHAPDGELSLDSWNIDVEPHRILVLRVARHMLGDYLQKALFPFRMLVDFVLGATARLAYSSFTGVCFVAKFANSFANRSRGNFEKRAQRLYRKAIVSDRLGRNKKPSLPFIKCHKERYFFFLETYWRFFLQSCNYLISNYKDTKLSPVFVV